MRIFRTPHLPVSQPEFADSAVRRTWGPSALLVTATIAVGVLSYSLSMQVAAERRQTEGLARANAELSATLKSLDAELRVRMRLPQLQRWNDDVLGLMPINATQYLTDPLQLAAYAAEASAAAAPARPQVQYAVRDLAPRAAPRAAAPLREVKAEPPAPVARPQRVAYVPPARNSAADTGTAAPHGIARPQEAPADLLAQIDVAFAGPPGRSFEP